MTNPNINNNSRLWFKLIRHLHNSRLLKEDVEHVQCIMFKMAFGKLTLRAPKFIIRATEEYDIATLTKWLDGQNTTLLCKPYCNKMILGNRGGLLTGSPTMLPITYSRFSESPEFTIRGEKIDPEVALALHVEPSKLDKKAKAGISKVIINELGVKYEYL